MGVYGVSGQTKHFRKELTEIINASIVRDPVSGRRVCSAENPMFRAKAIKKKNVFDKAYHDGTFMSASSIESTNNLAIQKQSCDNPLLIHLAINI